MGAKPSTAQGDTQQTPRTRAFSTSSSTDVVTAPGFRFMRSLGVTMSNDRQRARSLSSVPDLHTSHETIPTGASFDVSTGASPETDSSSTEDANGALGGSTASSIALGRVYAAHSLPSHIWSLNGIKCPVCSKFVIPDDIECHLVMCLTKPRLSCIEYKQEKEKIGNNLVHFLLSTIFILIIITINDDKTTTTNLDLLEYC